MAHPLVKIAAQAANNMVRFASELGLTPVARQRLAGAAFEHQEDYGKFAGLLA